jgi:hypothetical protein
MNESEDGTAAAQAWLAQLLRASGSTATAATISQPAAPALAALAAEALARAHSVLLVTADDQPLPDISNALDLNLRPLCLVLPAADYVCRIAVRATLSLLKSRLTRTGDAVDGSVWRAQRQRMAEQESLWHECLRWSERSLDSEPWPARMAALFPVRILPLALARQLEVASDWVVLVDTLHLPEDVCRPWPGAFRTLLLEDAGVAFAAGPPVAADPATRRRAEIEVLTQELSELELELATAQGEIADFTRRYHALIGARISMLDELQAQLAAWRAAAAPGDSGAALAAEAARKRAEQSRQERQRFADLDLRDAKPFAPGTDIKKLYRKIAQKIHPDRARSDADRAWRTHMMAEANRAYQAGDEVALLEVLALWRDGAWREESVAGAGNALEVLDAQVALLRRRIGTIEDELNRLFGSRLYELFTAANIARRGGRDLLQEMADRLDADIAAARDELGRGDGQP